MFDRALGEYEGAPQEDVILEQPQPGALYATGADWARSKDWTIIATLRYDVQPMRLVAFKRTGRLPWPVMIREFDQRVNAYPGAALHDGTGLGDVVDSYLTVPAEKFILVGQKRADLLSEYISALENGEMQAPYIKHAEVEHRYASWNDVFGAGHCPDTIIALALAYRAAREGGSGPLVW